MGIDAIHESPEIDLGLGVTQLEGALTIRGKNRLLQSQQQVADAALPGAIGTEQNRQWRHPELFCVFPGLEVLDPQGLQHVPLLSNIAMRLASSVPATFDPPLPVPGHVADSIYDRDRDDMSPLVPASAHIPCSVDLSNSG